MACELVCSCLPCFGSDETASSKRFRVARECKFDQKRKGEQTTLSDDQFTLSGDGSALGEAPLIQGKTYFEATIKKNEGSFSVGLATRKVSLSEQMGVDEHSWSFRSDLSLIHNGTEEPLEFSSEPLTLEEDDVIGCAFDHSSLSFFHNGVSVDQCFYKVRGTVFPCVSVAEGAVLELNFGQNPFRFPLASELGYQGVLFESSLI